MLLVIETMVPWTGEALKKTISAEEMAAFDPKRMEEGFDEYEVMMRHPAAIEFSWSDQELAAIGLARIVPAAIPEGKVRVGNPSYQMREDGRAQEVFALEDAPAPAAQPTKTELLEQIATLKAQVEALEE